MAQYMAANKATRDNLKDVGGFIGGELRNGIRKAGYVVGRDIVTLDMDNIPPGQTEFVVNRILSLGVNVCVYSTRKHSPEAPRLRAVFPLNRTVAADEYEPIARKIAQIIVTDMSWFDPTTFDVSRIMYWPSICSDSQYVYKWYDGLFVDADGILAPYTDWRSFTEWPKCPAENMTHAPSTRQEDPLKKKGVVGAFCRTYSVREAIDKFLPGVYVPAGDDRFTYAKGSTTGGAIVYEDKFLYSHHATDPACNLLCNAFDLVRVHLFRTLDDQAKENTPPHKLPSFTRMTEYALEDEQVQQRIRKEKLEEVYSDFAEFDQSGSGAAQLIQSDRDVSWAAKLKMDGRGGLVKSYENVLTVLENDPLLKGRILMDVFANLCLGIEPLPWGSHTQAKYDTYFEWRDADDSGLYMYIEKVLGMRNSRLVNTALDECRAKHLYHPVKEYLSRLNWDGIPRLETVFQTYLGAEDNPYVRALAKMTFVAAITRIYQPGTKFDTVIVLVGPQGIGKSHFISVMAKSPQWFTDNVTTFDKAAVENIQGVWLAELAELSALKRSELETTKAFISRQNDRQRPAYGRYPVDMPRSCIFFGTTNTDAFLKDDTGERRFYPVDVGVVPAAKSVFYDLPNAVDQIWAEALYYYREGKTPLILPEALRPIALERQKAHKEDADDPMVGIVEAFLSRPIPPDWDAYSYDQRQLFLADTATERTNLVPREQITTVEIWHDCYGKPSNAQLPKTERKKIRKILTELGYKEAGVKLQPVPYGKQRYLTK